MPRGAMIQTTEETCDVCGLPKLKIIRKGSPPDVLCVDPKCQSNVSANTLGHCPSCKGDIRIMFSKAGRRFAGCSGWPECKQTYPLRPTGKIVPAGRPCETCGAPVILFGKGEQCINKDCPGKKKGTN
jgi:DNA topoisomerase-1